MIVFSKLPGSNSLSPLEAIILMYPSNIREKVAHKRKIRKLWHTRCPQIKKTIELHYWRTKKYVDWWKKQKFQYYLRNLNITKATDYSFWKAIKKLKQLHTLYTNQMMVELGVTLKRQKLSLYIWLIYLCLMYWIGGKVLRIF